MSEAPYETISGCRACESPRLAEFLDLGQTPLADRLLRPEQLGEPEPTAPLHVVLCEDCGLVQITETVAPEVLFCQDYPYYSSVSKSLMEHFGASARRIIEARKLDGSSLVVEAASNDGYMLRHFAERHIPVLGIDPAEGPVRAARDVGVDTLQTFFSKDLALQLVAHGKEADVLLANNVLAHVADLNGFVEAIAILLRDDGIAVIEVPYLLDLVAHREFDTIYHQHLCYFSVKPLVSLFGRHGLYLNRVERTSIHGGSLRLFVEKGAAPDGSVEQLVQREEELGADGIGFYRTFGREVEQLKAELVSTLRELKAGGARIAGYGAAAKACTLMSYCGIGAEHLQYVVDLNEHKHGRHMGGNRLPIVPPEQLLGDRPDYLLILAWNFADEIMKQQSALAESGGRFIVPVPEVKVLP